MTMTLEQREARYHRMKAARDSGATLEDIAATEGITKERARQVLAKPPGRVGRPPAVDRIAHRIGVWEKRLASRTARFGPDDPRTEEARDQLAGLRSALGG